MALPSPTTIADLPSDILTDILVRVGCTKTLATSVAVLRGWRDLIRSVPFLRQYMMRHCLAIRGFLMETESIGGRTLFLIPGEHPIQSATILALRGKMDVRAMAREEVVSSVGGSLITRNMGRPRGFSVSSAYGPRGNNENCAHRLRQVPRGAPQYSVNTLGQFGVLPHVGPGGMAFFVRDPSGEYDRSSHGVSFESRDTFHVNVSVFRGNRWHRYYSPPIEPTTPQFFRGNPSCFLRGDTLICAYMLDQLVSFNLRTRSWSFIPLPFITDSESTYVVGEHSVGCCTIVHEEAGQIARWPLILDESGFHWGPADVLNLMASFHELLQETMWDRLINHDPNIYDGVVAVPIQLRAVSRDADIVLLTVGFDHGLFVLDARTGKMREMFGVDDDYIVIERLFQVTEPWPPRGCCFVLLVMIFMKLW